MKSVKDIYAFTQSVVGQEWCEKHDRTYNLIETAGGVIDSCPDCIRERIELEDQQIRVKATENKKGWQHSYIERFEQVSSDLHEAKISNYKPAHDTQVQAKNMAIDYIKTFDGKKSLVLSGGSGRGKSHIAYAITKGLRQRDYKTLFIKARDFLELIKSTYQNGAELTEERIFKVIETIDLLIIDDFGSEYVKSIDNNNESWASDLLYAVLDARLNKSTVITTNYTTRELEAKYGHNGDRIVSRMLFDAKSIRIEGEDHRRNNAF